jgi:hypothetical protein
VQISRRRFLAASAGLAAPFVIPLHKSWAQSVGLIPLGDNSTTLAQRLAHNDAEIVNIVGSAAQSRLLEIDDVYEFSQTIQLPGEVRVVARRAGFCGFSFWDDTKPIVNVDGGAGAEYGGQTGLLYTRQLQPSVADRAVPLMRLTGSLYGYRIDALDMKVAGRCISIAPDAQGREPYGLWATECRFSGHGSAVYSQHVTNGTRLFDCNFNGGYWNMTQHYDKGDITLKSGPGWMPVKNALFETDGSGMDGVVLRRCIANYAGGLFWSHNSAGNCVGVEVKDSWADGCSSAFVHCGGVNTRDVTVQGKVWSFFGPNWMNGAYVETFGPQGVRKVSVELDCDGISGCLLLTATRPDYSNSSIYDLRARHCLSVMGGRASPGNLRMMEFAGALVDYAHLDDCWGSGYAGILGGDGSNVTNRQFTNLGTLPY